MKIIDDVISTLNSEASVRDVRLGLFHTAVLTRHCGLATTLPRDVFKQGHKEHSTVTRVIDPQLVLRCVSQGATYRQIKEFKNSPW